MDAASKALQLVLSPAPAVLISCHNSCPCLSCCLLAAADCWLLQVVQFLTVDYGIEFCDYYGARCNRQMIETCRVKQVPDIPSSVKLSWVEHKVPIPIKGQGGASAAAAAAAPPPLGAFEAPVTSSTFSLI